MITSKIHDKIYITRIDANDDIIHVNDNWIDFARDNNANELTLNTVLGKEIWNYIGGQETCHLYRALFTKARNTGLKYEIPFRCDSPNCRRFMKLQIVPLADGTLEIRSYTVKEEYRDPVDILDSRVLHSHEYIRMCSNCKRIFIAGSQWCEVEEAIAILDLFAKSKVPKITHGFCPDCYAKFMEILDDIESVKDGN